MNYIRYIRSMVGHARIILNFAGGAVENERGEVLLQRRADKGIWGFPGGAIELGESAAEAAVREVREESGLAVEIEHLIGIYTKYDDRYPNGDEARTITHFFRCRIVGGGLFASSDESLELRFFPLDQVPPLANPQHRDMLEDVRRNARGVYR